MTIGQYCEKTGKHRNTVNYRIKNGMTIPGVASYDFDMKTKSYILNIIPGTRWAAIQKEFRKNNKKDLVVTK